MYHAIIRTNKQVLLISAVSAYRLNREIRLNYKNCKVIAKYKVD